MANQKQSISVQNGYYNTDWSNGSNIQTGGSSGAVSRVVFTLTGENYVSGIQLKLSGTKAGDGRMALYLSDRNFSPSQCVDQHKPWYWEGSSLLINNSIGSSQEIGNNTGNVAVFNGSSLTVGKTYYIYCVRYHVKQQYDQDLNWPSLNFEFVQFTNIIPPKIQNSSAVLIPEQKIDIRWSQGINGNYNAITGYNLTIFSSENPTGKSFSLDTSVDHYVYEIDFSRGDNIFAKIEAIGQRKNALSETASLGNVNRLPILTVVQKGELIITGRTVSFTLQGTDADSHKLTYSYSINNGDWILCDTQLAFTVESQLPEGENSIYFRAYDGYEEVFSDIYSFVAQYKPFLTAQDYTYIFSEGKGQNITKVISAFFTCGGNTNNLKAEVTYRIFDQSGNYNDSYSEIHTPVLSNNRYSFSIEPVKVSALAAGASFQIYYRLISEGGRADDVSEISKRMIKPKMPSRLQYLTPILKDEDGKIITKKKGAIYYFYDRLYFECGTSPLADGQANIQNIFLTLDDGIQNYKFTFDFHSGSSYILKLGKEELRKIGYFLNEDTNEWCGGKNLQISIQILDGCGFELSYTLDLLYKRIIAINFLPSAKIKSPLLVKPLSDHASYEIRVPKILESINNLPICYQAYYSIGSSVIFTLPLTRKDQDWDQDLIYELTSDFIKTFFLEKKMDINKDYDDFKVIISATDEFTEAFIASDPIKIHFIEPPIFSNALPLLYHNYDISAMTIPSDKGMALRQGKVSLDELQMREELFLRLINPEEKIIFTIPEASDLNNDLVRYEIYYSKQPFKDANSINQDFEGQKYEVFPLISITPMELTKNESSDNFYYFQYTVPNSFQNMVLSFKIRAVDSKNRYTEIRTDAFFIVGRLVKPRFDLEGTRIYINEDSQQELSAGPKKLNFQFNMAIKDLGGNSQGKWSWNFFDRYPNLERLNTRLLPKIGVLIEISLDKTFDTIEHQLLVSNEDELEEVNPTSSFRKKERTRFSAFRIGSQNIHRILLNETTSNKILFIRISLVVGYGLDSSRATRVIFPGMAVSQSEYFTYTYSGDSPTVSYRRNKIGINTKAISDEDVLVVSDFYGQKFIHLIGIDPSRPDKKSDILINLQTGQIDGAILDGGSWDEI